MKNKEYSLGVYIGRFQPFHNGHLHVVLEALEKCEKLLMLVGSVNLAPSIRNPWSFNERRDMIYLGVPYKYRDRLIIEEIRDSSYMNSSWIANVKSVIWQYNDTSKEVLLVGHGKDETSWYLKAFPEFNYLDVKNVTNIDASNIREQILEGNPTLWPTQVPEQVCEMLLKLIKHTNFTMVREEYIHVKEYRKSWEGSPYEPIFVTTDAVVLAEEHVLVVRRGVEPGKGKIALPGGFLNAKEPIQESCFRELFEETNISLSRESLLTCLKDTHVFDSPNRSSRGRTITQAYCFDIENMAYVTGGDDADKAFWFPLVNLGPKEREFFEDHAQIINFFLIRQRQKERGWIGK